MAIDRLAHTDTFPHRHIGPGPDDVQAMLSTLGFESLDALCDATVPADIRLDRPLALQPALGESAVTRDLRRMAGRNRVLRSFIGMGYHGCIVPPVIQRNVLENPGWYTQYTPYQAEISQGRLEALLNFQTMVADLTGLPMTNSSLLDEATAAAEAMHLCDGQARGKRKAFFVARDAHPQTIAVVRTRAAALGIQIHTGDPSEFDFEAAGVCGALLQYPTTFGRVHDYSQVVERIHAAGALAVVAADVLALALLRPPGEFGADVAVGSTQRFGVPMGFGGPHAAYMATTDKLKRRIPGRIIGVSKDSAGNPALRLALQTREQHIRREKATSNICTAQVLLAVMASMYAVYHGPEGIRRIARRVHAATSLLRAGLKRLGCETGQDPAFDTLRVDLGERSAEDVMQKARKMGMNLRPVDLHTVAVTLDETVGPGTLRELLECFTPQDGQTPTLESLEEAANTEFPAPLSRTSAYLTHEVFGRYHSETEMLRYMRRLESRDLSLCQSMISLGSCTMKLNGTTEMLPISLPGIAHLHPFAPPEQTEGYQELFRELSNQLAEITGFHSVSLQPNAGAQGEYTGLLVIRKFHEDRGHGHRNVCLIPASAHGTNPASAVMAGMKVVVVRCDEGGNIDVADLRAKAEQHAEHLSAVMITYPSTHGVFESAIREACGIVHEFGGQVYLDGANMNAQVGLCRPGDFGADVCHLNLHKTFCIPHGGGGPGMGPIGVAEHLAPYLPGHPVVPTGGERGVGAVAAAPWGSPSILPISYAYILLMGPEGLTRATQVAILNANYMAKCLEEHYPVLYRGENGRVAHEFILDFRDFEHTAHVTVEDVAKRLMDYGFHAPTMSFPVPGTLMIEPTESETKAEMDRFCDAMIRIREEIRDVAEGRIDASDNPLKNAPHTAEAMSADEWTHPYTRRTAAFPAPWVAASKFWPAVGRVDNVYGDRNLVCTCPSISEYA